MRCGVIANAYFNQPDGWYYVDGIIWDDKAQDLINKGWSVSCSYDYLAFNDEGGEENNIHYDKEFTQLNFTHLAIVDNPRYERANIVFNSKIKSTEVNNEDQWITIHPNGKDAKGKHLLLKDGESPKEAIERTYGKGEKSDTKDGSKDISKEEYAKIKEQVSKMSDDELVKAHFESQKGYESETLRAGSMTKHEATYGEVAQELKRRTGRSFSAASTESEIKEALSKAKSDSKGEKKYTWDDKEYTADELMEKGFKPMKYSGSIYKDDHLTYLEKNDGKKLYRVKISEDEYKELENKRREKNRPIGMSDVSNLLSDKDKFKKFADDLYSETDDYENGVFHKANVSGELRKALYHTIKTNSLLTQSEWEEKLYRHLKKINKANNSKENEMALIEELKKLITKVENTKGEEEMEIENEKVDKRKLIDEVAGIMKSAGCDDEDIRTAIGKMEKIGYDDSEASADNKKVKNEADEEDKKVDNEEDEKEEDKKVDNEDDKEEDKVDNESEEDKEKAEDLKEEEKKDVENKCKNSVGNAKGGEFFDKINKIYNSAKKIEEPSVEYESKQARLEAGKEYFG